VRKFARLPAAPAPDDVLPEEREAYERVVERTQRMSYETYDTPARYFGALLNTPPLAAGLVQLGTLVRQGEVRGSYTDADRELVDVVLGTDLGYNGIFTVHLPDAVAVGVRIEAIEAIRAGRLEELTPAERQIVDYARAVVQGEVTDESYAVLCERLGARGALEFTIFVGFLLMTIRMWQALGVPDPTDEEIDELVRGLRDGSVPIPDRRARIG
jgi:alkylhydroperoxidase family enzyme